MLTFLLIVGQCAGPAEIRLRFKEFTRNEGTYRNYVQNREEWEKLLSTTQKANLTKLVTAVVKCEAAVSTLIEELKKPDGQHDRVLQVGSLLFYHILVYMGDETDEHPLTRKFFHSALEVLGQYFVANQAKQCGSLLETCLNNQRSTPLLISHFTPNIVPGEFLNMYRRVQHSLQVSRKNSEFNGLQIFGRSDSLGKKLTAEHFLVFT